MGERWERGGGAEGRGGVAGEGGMDGWGAGARGVGRGRERGLKAKLRFVSQSIN